MSRLVIPTNSEAQNVVEGLYKDLERRIIASPPGLCPHEQGCGSGGFGEGAQAHQFQYP